MRYRVIFDPGAEREFGKLRGEGRQSPRDLQGHWHNQEAIEAVKGQTGEIATCSSGE
jgi:hypothetical protein